MRIVLVDDHAIVREGLRALIDAQPDLRVIGEVADGAAAIALCKELRPDVAVMDLTMPGLNGVEATKAIVQESPDTRVLCLSMHADRRMVAAALQAGASGYLLKDGAFDELTVALQAVAQHGSYLSPPIAGGVVQGYLDGLTAATADDDPQLTRREVEVLQLLAEGHRTKEIAAQLGITGKTVATHRENIMGKLSLRSIAELTRYAIRRGITTDARLTSP